MPRFVNPLESPVYMEQALFLYKKYSKYLDDDYACDPVFEYFYSLVKRTEPLFFVILEGDMVSGFVYLDNIIGSRQKVHSAELTTCFDSRFWGEYTKISAHIFLNYCFAEYGFEKIKALVYPENFRVKTLLKNSGFVKEALLKNETMRGGRLQDIEVYSCFKEKYVR